MEAGDRRGFAVRSQPGHGPRLRFWLAIAARAALVVVLVLSVVQLLAPSTYLVPGGEVSLRLRPSLPGGKIVMPLGPAGRIEMHTHRTPINLEVAYELAGRETLGQISSLKDELPAARSSAEKAFTSFALGKIVWVAVLGIVAGLLVVSFGRSGWRRLLTGAAAGLLAVGISAGAFAGVSYATLDRSPSVAFFGLARDLPRAVSAVGSVSGALKDEKLGFGRFVGALETISRQLQPGDELAPADGGRVRLLLATDLHLNPVGARLTRQLANSRTSPVAALLLGGDMTYFGTAAEAKLFARELGKIRVPVLAIGGNHESGPAMAYFRRLSWTMLNSTVTEVRGVGIMGFPDPSSSSPQLVSTPAQVRRAAAATAAAFAAQTPPPDVLLVHDVNQALPTVAAARSAKLPLLVLHGHDHVLRVVRKGSVTLIDGGTAGASGVDKLGAAPGTPYTFQIVEFTRRKDGSLEPASVTSLSYSGDGSSSAGYQPLGQ